ncbi:MAG: hypothetical protein ACRD5H_00875 [Nitrososphaerales archaeon]
MVRLTVSDFNHHWRQAQGLAAENNNDQPGKPQSLPKLSRQQMNITKAQMSVAMMVVQAMAEAIREVGSIPEGTLYAVMMNFVNLEGFKSAANALVNAKVVRRENCLLTWIAPPVGSLKTLA